MSKASYWKSILSVLESSRWLKKFTEETWGLKSAVRGRVGPRRGRQVDKAGLRAEDNGGIVVDAAVGRQRRFGILTD